ncbi:MAG: indolepyruvate oxidoreductase subunit beta family protein [Burkholderiaceae bacterium]|nr:indolepyruvate oxidoreductase subunit beta family protein [Burkholderiaceae bacterium]
MDGQAAPVSILVCALGGEGGGVLSEWIYDTAVRCGHFAQTTAIPGVAQRSGATTYYIEVDPLPAGERDAPVFGLYPVPGALDLLLSSELLETVRQISHGLVSPERTRVISSTARTLTTAEKMALTDGRVDSARLISIVQRHARRADLFDMQALARQAETPISAVLLGALAASGVLPFPRDAYEAAIRASGKGVQANLRGFALAYDAVARGDGAAPSPAAVRTVPAPAPLIAGEFPTALHEVLALALPRLAEYQDAEYARLYLQRVRRLLAVERAADAREQHGLACTREAARLLAVWMTFDDIARVAQRKVAAARRARVRREVGAGAADLVRIYDFFKPGVPEVAALLPPPLAQRLLAWEQRRRARGRPPLEIALKLATHTVAGTLALRLLVALRRLRRYGQRYRDEQALIERWLAAVQDGLARHWQLGYEIAQCARLIKGYGATHERTRRQFEYILNELAEGSAAADPVARAEAIARARQAALADDQGQARSAQGRNLGLRPPREQPLVFVPRARGGRHPKQPSRAA